MLCYEGHWNGAGRIYSAKNVFFFGSYHKKFNQVSWRQFLVEKKIVKMEASYDRYMWQQVRNAFKNITKREL